MTLNLGRADQAARALLGTSLIMLAGMGGVDGAWRAAAVIAGSVAVFTAFAGHCPFYRVLGRSTCTQ